MWIHFKYPASFASEVRQRRVWQDVARRITLRPEATFCERIAPPGSKRALPADGHASCLWSFFPLLFYERYFCAEF